MPELPEVETVLRTLAPRLTGERLVEAQFYSKRIVRGRPDAVAARIENRTVRALARRGKFLLVEFEDGPLLVIHLGMTGKLLWEHAPGPYTRAQFFFVHGRLLYNDVRMFGRIEVSDGVPARVARLGPDPLTISFEDFAARLSARRGAIKPLLLNQAFLGGLGNIYADEALFRARIHPRAVAARLGKERVRRLYCAIREVLEAAIASGGSSVSDYVDAQGRAGRFQFQHLVYRKTGDPCAVCGKPIRRIVLAQRGTHYCSGCQRR